MNENSPVFDWAAGRGEKWATELSGLEAMLDSVDDPLIQALQLEVPCRVADVGCGGGGTTLKIHRTAPTGSVVHGFDISPALIQLAHARTEAADGAPIFALADVATAPAPDEPYERLVSRFGTMFYADPPAAFANLGRWLRPGGRFAFAVWGPPAENEWMTSVSEVAAEFVDVPPLDLEVPGPCRYAGADKLLGLLEGAGFRGLEVKDWRGQLPIGGGLAAAEAAHFALTSFSVGELLTEAGDEVCRAALRALTTRYIQNEDQGIVQMAASVHIVAGGR